MSDLPGEMTMQSLSAPPRTSRSTRYSLTARGRSRSPSYRLPTGNSSFENASGCMRLPWPAAGMMPHMIDDLLQFPRARRRGVKREHPLARPPRQRGALAAGHLPRRVDVFGAARHDDFAARREEAIEPFPPVADERRAARRRFEHTPGRAIP